MGFLKEFLDVLKLFWGLPELSKKMRRVQKMRRARPFPKAKPKRKKGDNDDEKRI